MKDIMEIVFPRLSFLSIIPTKIIIIILPMFGRKTIRITTKQQTHRKRSNYGFV